MTSTPKLGNPPIIEAILDIDCELPPSFDIRNIEKPARKALTRNYPKLRPIFIQDHRVEATSDNRMKYSVEGSFQGFQFLKQDENQVVQFRSQGYSFNRLAPYICLDDYLPQIKKTWSQYQKLATPVTIRAIRMRYINRILLPMTKGEVKLDDYIVDAPRLADPERFSLIGFLDQYSAIDNQSGNQINSVLTLQPIVDDKLPLIFDNGVTSSNLGDVDNWNWIRSTILDLRELKNHIFLKTVTEKCLNLFR